MVTVVIIVVIIIVIIVFILAPPLTDFIFVTLDLSVATHRRCCTYVQ